MAKMLDCGLKVSEVEFQLFCDVHFWTNALWEKYEPPSFFPAAG